MMSRVVTAKDIINRDMYEHYRANRKKVVKGINQYNLWSKAVNGLLITLKQMVIDNENGVYIENFGYIRADRKAIYKKRVSVLKKIDRNLNTIKFTPFNEGIKDFGFTIGDTIYRLDADKVYESKLDAIQHIINLKKNKWIR